MSRKVLVLAIVLSCVATITACPGKCQCQPEGRGQHVVCHGDDLHPDFGNVPDNTVRLIVSGLTLQSLQPENFIKAPNSIRHLTITSSSLQGLGQSVFLGNLTSLLELDLSGNHLHSIAVGAFEGLTGLRFLNLSNNDLNDLGSALEPLVGLQQLDLSYNDIQDLHSTTFQKQTGLDYLCLDGNQIGTLNGDAFQALTFLSQLRVRNCSIYRIVDSLFSAIPRVNLLDLRDNKLKSPPMSTSFSVLKQLKYLYIDSNNILQLHADQFAGLRLLSLSLSHNRIGSIPVDAFNGLIVEDLDLSENKLFELKEESLQPLASHLVILNLAHNPVQVLPPNLFRDFRLLETLNISACSLTSVSAETFSSLYNLRRMDISKNHLQNVSENMVKVLSRLILVNMQQNSWLCDCHISPFRNWLRSPRSAHKLFCLREHRSQDCSDIRCSLPEHYEGKLISNLSDEQIEKCGAGAARSGLPVPVQISIVVGCLLFSVGMLLLAIYLWKRGRTRKELKQIIFQKKNKPDSKEEDEEENEKIEPFLDCDNESLKESHRSFVVKHYFDRMVTDPALLEPTSPSLASPAEQCVSPTQKDSMYSSNSSLYENSHKSCSVVVVGIESAV